MSIRVYPIADTHRVFFGFSFTRNQNQYIYFEPCEVPAVFPFINFYCKGSFFFGQSLKCFSADHLRCEHRHFYLATFVRLVLYILAGLGLRSLQESRYETAQAYFCLPQSRLQASTKRTYVCNTRQFSNVTPASQLRTN